VDVAVIGTPFLDLVFEGLPRLPAPGEEVVGKALHVVPGGSAIQAIGLARLGVPVALVSPRGTDPGGRVLEATLEREGVAWVGPSADDTPATAILSTPDGTAMATVTTHAEPAPEDITTLEPRLVVLSLGRTDLRPADVPACFVSGSIEIEAGVRPPDRARRGDLLVVTRAEAEVLSGKSDPEEAANVLSRSGLTAFVTMGADGAIAVRDEEMSRATAPSVDVVDATGAGDLFVSAIVWAALRELALPSALQWACLAASLSVAAPTALAGAVRLDALMEEGRRRGLNPP
jgi:ribokinase